jgi:putative nucleotidyltransferase with HDIG domain
LDVGAFWEHSVTTAVAASTLARRTKDLEAVAFTSGLLHDVGKLILAAVEPAQYKDLIAVCGSGGPEFVKGELNLFKVTHATVAAQLLTRWKLPLNVVDPVLRHHDEDWGDNPNRGLWASVRLGDAISHTIRSDCLEYPERPAEILKALEILKIQSDELPDIITDITEGLTKVRALLI